MQIASRAAQTERSVIFQFVILFTILIQRFCGFQIAAVVWIVAEVDASAADNSHSPYDKACDCNKNSKSELIKVFYDEGKQSSCVRKCVQ